MLIGDYVAAPRLGPILNVDPSVELGSIRSVIAKFLHLTRKLFVFKTLTQGLTKEY